VRYLSVCSGIEAATVAWHPLGWTPAGFAEIDRFPRAVLEHRQGAVAVDRDHRHSLQSNITPLFGDFTRIEPHHVGPIDLLVGGTPCQSFSIAGLRGGLDDDRGNLALEFLRLADRTRARWLVWENVPGVLSSGAGRDFGAILGGMVELGYGFAYRVLDAQFFGVPQRRRRVFVVGRLGSWQRAAAVLFERHSLSGHPAPRRKAGKIAPTVPSRRTGGVGLGTDFDCDGGLTLAAFGGNDTRGPIDVATACNAHGGPHGRLDFESETFVAAIQERAVSENADAGPDGAPLIAHRQRGEGFDASEDGTGRGTPLVPCEPYVLMERGRADGSNLEFRQDGVADAILTPNGGRGGFGVGAIAFTAKTYGADAMEDCSPTLRAGGFTDSHQNGGVMPAVAIPLQEVGKRTGVSTDDLRAGIGIGSDADPMFTLQAGAQHGVGTASAVRRLTPRECERLQGFPDDYTAIPWRGKPADQCPDGPRYKALGNSMAVPVMAWIGERIQMVEDMKQ